MKVKAPFQGHDERAGYGFDGRRFYTSVRFVLRACNPKPYPEWDWKFVWAAPVRRIYEGGRR